MAKNRDVSQWSEYASASSSFQDDSQVLENVIGRMKLITTEKFQLKESRFTLNRITTYKYG